MGLGGAVRFRPEAEQPGNLLSSKLILLAGSRTRGAEPQAHPRRLGSVRRWESLPTSLTPGLRQPGWRKREQVESLETVS